MKCTNIEKECIIKSNTFAEISKKVQKEMTEENRR